MAASLMRPKEPKTEIDKTLTLDGYAADAAVVGIKLASKLQPVMTTYATDINVSDILEDRRIFLIITLNGGSASKAAGNIGILANTWGIWSLTNFNKQNPDGDNTGYPSYSNGVLTVPNSWGFCYTVIFKL